MCHLYITLLAHLAVIQIFRHPLHNVICCFLIHCNVPPFFEVIIMTSMDIFFYFCSLIVIFLQLRSKYVKYLGEFTTCQFAFVRYILACLAYQFCRQIFNLFRLNLSQTHRYLNHEPPLLFSFLLSYPLYLFCQSGITSLAYYLQHYSSLLD